MRLRRAERGGTSHGAPSDDLAPSCQTRATVVRSREPNARTTGPGRPRQVAPEQRPDRLNPQTPSKPSSRSSLYRPKGHDRAGRRSRARNACSRRVSLSRSLIAFGAIVSAANALLRPGSTLGADAGGSRRATGSAGIVSVSFRTSSRTPGDRPQSVSRRRRRDHRVPRCCNWL